MPFIGLIPFLRSFLSTPDSSGFAFQCPLSGLFHFYCSPPDFVSVLNLGFNALYRAYSISTFCSCSKLPPASCFNALYRAYSISTIGKMEVRFEENVFQCPLSGLFHFYLIIHMMTLQNFFCFNALYRAYSISTFFIYYKEGKNERFQCPLSGLFHFYEVQHEKKDCFHAVSMPFIGLIPFLLKKNI